LEFEVEGLDAAYSGFIAFFILLQGAFKWWCVVLWNAGVWQDGTGATGL
jgi:hypothetical protein